MSLLMEALKKAEETKRKSAANDAAPAPARSEALTLELAPTPPRREAVAPLEVKPVLPEPQPAAATVAEARAKPEISSSSPPAAVAAPPLQVEPASATTHIAPPLLPPRARKTATLWIAGVGGVVLLLGVGGYIYYGVMQSYLGQQATVMEPPVAAPEPMVQDPPPPPPAPVVAEPEPEPVKLRKPVPSKPAVAAAKPAPAPKDAVEPATIAAPVPLASAPETPAEALNISRDADKTDIYATLQLAYAAYQERDDARARTLYAQVLAHEPYNRDALLGLAAVAVRNKDYMRAQDIYSELLTLDPRDSVAQAGFVSVTGSLDPVLREARIKTLLEQEPNAPHLLFTYASLLMQQQRWAEAARVLQSAHQAQRDNPDYAFNLAVSLDHLGQRATALQFYRAALDLAATRSATFSADDARRRIEALQATNEGEP
jgi:Flp pilus assembly protein TadD